MFHKNIVLIILISENIKGFTWKLYIENIDSFVVSLLLNLKCSNQFGNQHIDTK